MTVSVLLAGPTRRTILDPVVVRRLFRKLGARNRAHAVALAYHFGLLANEEVA
jgi:hypothetical protein